MLESPGADCPACLLGLALETSSGSEEPAPSESGEDVSRHRLVTGGRVGPYTIVRELGEGGMGLVYLAEQTEPIKRRVALKVVKHGMDTDQVVKRFEAERQALALMDHVAIAKVFEAGETDTGRPYFAMEFIDGEPITDYCDRKRLATGDRLSLFSRVCEGVQHAHRRGIIHRDIKPSNVLVTEIDGEPQPKIIDFGVAKATEQSLTEHSAMTAMGVLLGTPEYMSPEQASLAPFDIDTRTDVYSLGVLLYELLTGALPFDRRALQKAAFDEVRRQIREVQPSKPSTRISQLGEQATGLAESRHTDVSSLCRTLAGDLDLITMKALEKERDRRYGSPAELADDIRRHLDKEPILARPPSVSYQLRKLAARNPLASGLAAAVLILLIVSVTVMAFQNRRIRAERDRAEREARTSEEVSSFLQELFEVPDPRIAQGEEISAREILDKGAARIETELTDQPEVQTRLMLIMGNVYHNLGVDDEAQRLLEPALERGRTTIGTDSTNAIEALRVLSWLHRRAGRMDEALAAAREGLELIERSSLRDNPIWGQTLTTLGVMLRDRGELEEAQQVLDRAVNFAERVIGSESIEYATALYHKAWLVHRLGRTEEALGIYERTCPIMGGAIGELHPRYAGCLSDHSLILSVLQRYDEAAVQLRRATEVWERVLPAGHPYLANAADNLGTQFWYARDYENAELHYRRGLAMREEIFGPDHPEIGSSLHNVALALRELGRWEEAEKTFQRSISIVEAAHGPDDDRVMNGLNSLAELYDRWKRPADALRLYERIVRSRERTRGPDHMWVAGVLQNQAEMLLALGRPDEAESVLLRAQGIVDTNLTGWERLGRTSIGVNLGRAYADQGKMSEAHEILTRVRDAAEQGGVTNVALARAYYQLHRLARAQGNTTEAAAFIDRALEVRRAFQPEDHVNLLYVEAISQTNRGETAEALRTLRRALDRGMRPSSVGDDFPTLRGNPGFEALLKEYD